MLAAPLNRAVDSMQIVSWYNAVEAILNQNGT